MLSRPLTYLDHRALMRFAVRAFPGHDRDELQDEVHRGKLTFAEIPDIASGEGLRRLAVIILELFDGGKQVWNLGSVHFVAPVAELKVYDGVLHGAVENGHGKFAVTDGKSTADIDDYLLKACDDETVHPSLIPLVRVWRDLWAAELRYFDHARQDIAARNPKQGVAVPVMQSPEGAA
jgi:hypothetical protein